MKSGIESLRTTAVGRVIITLFTQGDMHLSELCRKSEVAYAHLYRVLPAIVSDGMAVSYARKNRKCFSLTDKGKALAWVMENVDELPRILSKEIASASNGPSLTKLGRLSILSDERGTQHIVGSDLSKDQRPDAQA